LRIYHCEKCVEIIVSMGVEHLIFYGDLCAFYLKNGAYAVDPDVEPYVEKITEELEKSGFFISIDGTTGIKNRILVKPLGHSINEKGNYFCVDSTHLK
jgi:hypothetical protein